ncbi:MAG: VOC family protein, partial [Rhodobacteraceae bacterium]|nr:VOC family protein [Paracoccaceae bacterium]
MPHDQAQGHHHHDHDHDHHHHHSHAPLRLHTIRIYAGDFAGAFAFYGETLGLTCVGGSATGPFALFDTGAAQLALEHIPTNHPAYNELVGRFVGASFMVDNLSKTFADLNSKGVEFMAPPQR